MSSFTNKNFKENNSQPIENIFTAKTALNMNEMPNDLPIKLKDRIFLHLKNFPFNRYPEPYGESLAKRLAEWYDCDFEKIMVGPGSSSFIRLLLTYFGIHSKGKLIITRPSFSYYEQFCQAFDISYDTWELNENFQYEIPKLDHLPDSSVVFMSTPNNPTGNILSIEELERLLKNHKNSLFIIDEAYTEFAKQPLLPLFKNHKNIILLRTFSKAYCSAGIRCGVLIGDQELVAALKKLQTPFQLSTFAIEAIKIILEYEKETDWFKNQINQVILEREKLFQTLTQGKSNRHYTSYPSHANFLLIKAKNNLAHKALIDSCVNNGIMISNLDKEIRLSNCIRVTVGTSEENSLFQKALYQAIEKLS